MTLYEQWLQKADDIGLNVIENIPFESNARGLISGNCIGLNQAIETTAEKVCVLAEEVIHSQANTGCILDQRFANNARQEHATRKILYHHLADLRIIISLIKNGYQELNEIAEKMEITENLLSEAIASYKEEYGTHTIVEDCVIFFEPTISIVEKDKCEKRYIYGF